MSALGSFRLSRSLNLYDLTGKCFGCWTRPSSHSGIMLSCASCAGACPISSQNELPPHYRIAAAYAVVARVLHCPPAAHTIGIREPVNRQEVSMRRAKQMSSYLLFVSSLSYRSTWSRLLHSPRARRVRTCRWSGFSPLVDHRRDGIVGYGPIQLQGGLDSWRGPRQRRSANQASRQRQGGAGRQRTQP